MDDFEIQNIFNDLYNSRRIGYGKSLPGRLDDKYMALARYYSLCAPEKRTELRNRVTDEIRLFILGFSDRLSILAARNNDRNTLFMALLAHSLEDFKHDLRENILRLTLVSHVANRIGVDVNEMFKEVADLSSEEGKEKIIDFISRPPEFRSLKSMNIVEFETDEGVSYRYA